MKAAKPKPPRYPGPTAAITDIAAKIFGGHGSLRDVARFTGVSKDTVSTWLTKGREGDERYAAFAAVCDKALTVSKLRTWKKAEERDPKWVLVVRHGVKDKPTKVEHSGPGGGAIEIKKGLSAETLETIRREALGLKTATPKTDPT